ncbi:hypothetical protein ALC57_11634 [Trachymyrmex cornetzi]|uniref:Uncharacterized protein n=1 Tax=Trachymyrmex cornetzi TaxID=471704 RepID=A0A195DU92_9HYME|nr:hypothetical protein ALC57_11634 [Trachymyrmex cornetzi]
MIKLNNICIQYTAWCRRDTATSLTHTPWSTRLGPARSQHRKSDEYKEQSTGLNDESTVLPRFQRAIDPPGEPLSSSIGRFWRRRMAGR